VVKVDKFIFNNMKKDKVYELRIDEEDEISGIDSISLVDEPAIEVNWVAFNKHKHSSTEQCFHIPDGQDKSYLEKFTNKGQSEEELLSNGWEVYEEEKFVSSSPNAPSFEDTDDFLFRYKYVLNPEAPGAPIKETTREFCADLLNKNFVYRVEDMDTITNDEGDSALVWRGGYNCRHSWKLLKYRRGTDIINKGSITKGRVDGVESYDVIGYPQPDTRTSNPSFKKEFGYDNTLPSYVDEVSGDTISKSIAFESYTDYPESAKKAARRALDWAEKNGWGSCGTPVGKARANQLAKGEAISEETIARMASFARHAQNKDVPYSEGCGGLMWDAWGGTAGIEWASNKLESIRKDMSKQKFQTDDEKKMVVGPAMIPDLKIFRRDPFGNPYYVFFSADTIKLIAEKYMRNKYIDNNDENHNGKAVEDVYVVESWIKEDKEDKGNKYGYGDLPVGTWFVSMKVRNDEVWQKVKNGELKGFSVSGFFEEIADFAREQMFLQQVAEILKNVK
jgi:Putative phage serine protease XkdF